MDLLLKDLKVNTTIDSPQRYVQMGLWREIMRVNQEAFQNFDKFINAEADSSKIQIDQVNFVTSTLIYISIQLETCFNSPRTSLFWELKFNGLVGTLAGGVKNSYPFNTTDTNYNTITIAFIRHLVLLKDLYSFYRKSKSIKHIM